ncbi:MAG: bifunctional hydroxymethylpyrimidine kinase/phosphomethylpyrimidine kinase [Proteobacteria bacterium]|nr:bifunctional hydroxymethylpyrimidine kinase/phosphomethylpyrimidine kinase [Pseudomonadota bacterium]MBU1234104.1 bifunctional hydroxymethylpyrimidine kinase/phosphomethylpyrimidine kinase [Pseudomonadota bacterium]MBU1419694.1 bifunctional hydroxymethylpyrimidine kinase/phosphomethylpyrimidine kinase [Pseudomonadota bacterium]MBU1456449.1 bifunctional hydroxymethylpyrimidine kinase/phosphomethylpyrimidine kinase [Pseudomonadota bacterium]
MKNYSRVLTVAGSDSGGGAGIQADLKTFSALGCYGMSVITALTAQNTVTVTGIYPVPPEFIALQMDAVLTDIGADAVKIGMLHSPEVIRTVAECLQRYSCSTIVLDPVMVTRSGDKLLQDDAVQALKDHLFPMATVITPNLAEASVLLGRDVRERSQMIAACRDLAALGCDRVFLKGGALADSTSVDLLYDRLSGEILELESPRVDTRNSHGTGCTTSSAIAACLAKGMALPAAVREAKKYIDGALQGGAEVRIGAGHGPVHHFHKWWSVEGKSG